MCLRTHEINLEPSVIFNHTEGVIRVGSGMTWGYSKFGDVGVHQLANEVGRVVVSGHAGNVGIVGWSLGGGHGQLVGTYGMGVDQVLEVEMIIANGTRVVANAHGTTQLLQDETKIHSKDSSLFWALRGGGAGPWGIITAMTIKLHKLRNDCKKDCYTQWHATWKGIYAEDGPELLQKLIYAYLKWTGAHMLGHIQLMKIIMGLLYLKHYMLGMTQMKVSSVSMKHFLQFKQINWLI